LVVLVVVSILAAVALPAYRHHLLRVNCAEAMTLLLRLQSAEESHYLRHDHYTASIDAAPPAGLGMPVASTYGNYTLSVSLAVDGQSYIATMEPKIRELRALIESAGLGDSIDIEVDGGISTDTSAGAASAGANVFVAGTSLFRGF